jgi:hypothetical protein
MAQSSGVIHTIHERKIKATDLKSIALRFLLLSFFIGLVWLCGCCDLMGQSLSGTTGLFYTPTAEMKPDKTVILGLHQQPAELSEYYGKGLYDIRLGSAAVTFLPRLELMFRYTYLLGAERGPDINLFMDRMVSVRALILKERNYVPALLVGIHDPGNSTELAANGYFGTNYIAASKNVSSSGFVFGFHTGVAFDVFGEKSQTMKGLFGGISISHSSTPWANVIFEHDSRRINTALKLLLFNHFQVMAGLIELKYPSGGVGLQIQL